MNFGIRRFRRRRFADAAEAERPRSCHQPTRRASACNQAGVWARRPRSTGDVDGSGLTFCVMRHEQSFEVDLAGAVASCIAWTLNLLREATVQHAVPDLSAVPGIAHRTGKSTEF
jgi:hypothetical protein